MNSCFVGLNYYHTGKTYPVRKTDTVPDKKFHISLYPTVGYRESLKYLGDKYFVSSATLELQRAINQKQVLGIGLAFFYDATEKVWTKHNTDPVEKDKDAIYGGLQLSHEIKLHPLYIVFQMGTYIYNYQILDGTKIYNRMGLKYHINKHVFVSFTHKSSFFFNGDNIEWGIGYKI